jgi:hypothetical protein
MELALFDEFAAFPRKAKVNQSRTHLEEAGLPLRVTLLYNFEGIAYLDESAELGSVVFDV